MWLILPRFSSVTSFIVLGSGFFGRMVVLFILWSLGICQRYAASRFKRGPRLIYIGITGHGGLVPLLLPFDFFIARRMATILVCAASDQSFCVDVYNMRSELLDLAVRISMDKRLSLNPYQFLCVVWHPCRSVGLF